MTKTRKRYIKIIVDGKWFKEHRFVVEQAIGRKLLPTEDVHHKDGNTTNNVLSNLEIMNHTEHSRYETQNGKTVGRLTLEDIRDIRKMLNDGIRHWLIALAFGIDRTAITKIHTGTTWSWAN